MLHLADSKGFPGHVETVEHIMSARTNRLAAQLGRFIQQYRKKAQRSAEPNDRSYSRKAELEMKRLPPDALSEVLSGETDEVVPVKETKKARSADDPSFAKHKKRVL
jgi:hypothetical protein